MKLKKELAETSLKIVEDEEKAAVRANEAVEAEAEKKAMEADLANKKAKLAEFETTKKEADEKITKEFSE